MNTTLYRSLALLISMFALTSSFSLSMNLRHNNSKIKTKPIKQEDYKGTDTDNDSDIEDSWTLEMVDLKDTSRSIEYILANGIQKRCERKRSVLYNKTVMKYSLINEFFFNKKHKDNFDSIFGLIKQGSENAIIGVISKDCKLYLFSVNNNKQESLNSGKEYVLAKTNHTFLPNRVMKETKEGHLKLYFNGESGKVIEIKVSYKEKHISPEIDVAKNHHILFWSITVIISGITLVAVFAICKYWSLQKKELSISRVG